MHALGSRSGQGRGLAIVILIGVLLAGGAAGYYYRHRIWQPGPPSPIAFDPPKGDIEAQVHHFCGGCHAYPPAHTFPKEHWQHEVETGYRFFSSGGKQLRPTPIDDVLKYYVERAPE